MSMFTKKTGFLAILSAPSGAGKSTLARHLLKTGKNIRLSISTTTRPPRPGEREGEHYFFVDQQHFQKKIAENAFLEWAQVFGNYYGTSRETVDDALIRGETVLLDIDWQGARQIRQNLPATDVVSIFILPPDHDTLLHRLQGRGQDDSEVIARRMAKASDEISHWHEYDYLLINKNLKKARAGLSAIIDAERMRRERAGKKIQKILETFPESVKNRKKPE